MPCALSNTDSHLGTGLLFLFLLGLGHVPTHNHSHITKQYFHDYRNRSDYKLNRSIKFWHTNIERLDYFLLKWRRWMEYQLGYDGDDPYYFDYYDFPARWARFKWNIDDELCINHRKRLLLQFGKFYDCD
ncbi:hypothetical protein ONZ43_g6181 [Nemania bipapillata]|uniref:Uncharacterized protein n=1 Tax=Nemania bipapillata TaxID=110536 RepID=A0ACC2I1Q7_9PEZI|nr:hypothetical protein ONZ43_g6181 [Nemania bipapillata]